MAGPLLTVPAVYTDKEILEKHRGKPPSMRVYLHPNHFRINDSQETLPYASPMGELLKAVRSRTIPHNMLEDLHAIDTPFYDNCMIVEMHNFRNNGAKPKEEVASSSAGTGQPPFSVHNYNNFITPSPDVPYPTAKPEPKASVAEASKEAANKENKENVPAPGQNGNNRCSLPYASITHGRPPVACHHAGN
jgi:transcription factor SPT20